MHNKFHTLLVDRLTNPLDEVQRQVLLDTLHGISSFITDQYQRYITPNRLGGQGNA
jgi:hypothetical protein